MSPIVHYIKQGEEVRGDGVTQPLCFGDPGKGHLTSISEFAYFPVRLNLSLREIVPSTQKLWRLSVVHVGIKSSGVKETAIG